MRFPDHWIRRTAAVLVGAALLTGCGAQKVPQALQGQPTNKYPQRAGLLDGSTPKPGAYAQGGPYGPDLSPVKEAWVRHLFAEADGYTLSLQEAWSAHQTPTGVQLHSNDGTVGEIQRLAAAPREAAVRVPAGCRQEAQTKFPLWAGPGVLTQLHCAPTGQAEYDQVNVYLASHRKHYFYWLRGRKSFLMKQADQVGSAIDVLP